MRVARVLLPVVLLAGVVRADVRPRIDAALDRLEASGDIDAAGAEIEGIFDEVVLAAPKDGGLFTDAAFARRLVGQLAAVDAPRRGPLLEYLRRHDALARELAFLVDVEREEPAEVYALLDRMRERAPEHLPRYPALAAALCVVHDRPLKRRVNENTTVAEDPLVLLEYYIRNEKRMLFGVQNVPAELLVYVVDCTAPLGEMSWALGRYAGHRQVGALFFEIDYDYDHFLKGRPKKVTTAGYTLPNIARHGGVCADQAYFAMSVGKSIGVPTAYTRGRNAEVSHAWVGFLQADRRAAWWDFDSGRYDAYRGVQGRITDPQTGRPVASSTVSLLARLSAFEVAERRAAKAYVDAGRRMVELVEAERPPADGGRPVTIDSALELVELGLRECPGEASGWLTVRDLAEDGQLDLDEKKRWAALLEKQCGDQSPDFALAVLAPMVATVEDLDEQNRLWNRAFKRFERRLDLAAKVRFAQGKMWEDRGELAKAGQCYEDVIRRYANAGPFVVDALRRAEKVLEQMGAGPRIPVLYEQAWSLTERPRDMAREFSRQSNWYRVGKGYARRLEDAGRSRDAEAVRKKLTE